MCVWMAPFHSKWVTHWSSQMYTKCYFRIHCELCLCLTPISGKIQHLIQLNDHLSLSKYETVCHSFQNKFAEWSRPFVILSSKKMNRWFHSNNRCLVQRYTYNWSSEYAHSTALAGSHLTVIQLRALCAQNSIMIRAFRTIAHVKMVKYYFSVACVYMFCKIKFTVRLPIKWCWWR